MKLTNDINKNLETIRKELNIGKSFDVIERVIDVHKNKFYMFYLDGFVKDTNLEYVRRDMYNLKQDDFNAVNTANDLIEKALSSIEASTESNIHNIITSILSGQTALLGPNFTEAILLDFRTYPSRGINEPAKEKVLRGAHDGFVETLVSNTALIRRRIRDPELTFKMYNIGSISKTDLVLGYLNTKVKKSSLKNIEKLIEGLKIKSLTLGDQSLIEVISSKSNLNPFPKVRYTERPDVAAAQLIEGSILILIDNTPSALIIPSNLFDFMQSIDDYYMPVFTGNYLKLLRNFILLLNLFLTPVYVLLTDNPNWFGGALNFLFPKEPYVIPLFMQFFIAELAIDGLKLASLNTPDSLGTSLSIIGGLILGDYAVDTGWFIPHTILYSAIIALTSFIQPSIELSFALKFIRIILLLLTGFFGIYGFIAGIIINFIILAFTKSLTGEPYLYPLFPFNWNALKHLLFRCEKEISRK